MKKLCFVSISAAAALFCGCQHTHVDQVNSSEGMQDWYKDIRANYPGFQPPALVSPGVSGQSAPAVKQQTAAENNATADNNIDAIPVDPAEETKAEAEAKPEVKPEVKAETEAKPEVKPEAKAETEAKPEVKPEAKAETAKIEPPDPTSSEIYVVQSGDTLGAISKKFYGSVRFVNLIQKANSDIVANANVLKPGMKLIIPKL